MAKVTEIVGRWGWSFVSVNQVGELERCGTLPDIPVSVPIFLLLSGFLFLYTFRGGGTQHMRLKLN